MIFGLVMVSMAAIQRGTTGVLPSLRRAALRMPAQAITSRSTPMIRASQATQAGLARPPAPRAPSRAMRTTSTTQLMTSQVASNSRALVRPFALISRAMVPTSVMAPASRTTQRAPSPARRVISAVKVPALAKRSRRSKR
jgi:hypothetical protein